MGDTYYRDNEIKFVLADCVGTGVEYDEVLYSTVEIYIGDNNECKRGCKDYWRAMIYD